MDLKSSIIELYRKVATELPLDVISALKSSLQNEEKGSLGEKNLELIIKNAELAKSRSRPMCQDTGTPIFFVEYGHDYRQKELKNIIEEATKTATSQIPLRPNTTDILTGKNTGNNVFSGVPVMYFEECDIQGVKIGLLLKGGGCENVGKIYTLPNIELQAGRDLDGIRRCILHSALLAQGKGCPPMIASVVAGSPEDLVMVTAKRQLLRHIGSHNPSKALDCLEKRLTNEINELGIGPSGFSGKTTVLATFIDTVARHPASFFVHISYFCWASRRGILEYHHKKASYAL